jgi:hypothetical protein
MSRPPDNLIKLKSETLDLCEYKSGGSLGFWLYDETRSMNLAMRAKTKDDAFVEALHYYQERLLEVEQEYVALQTKVNNFVSQFCEEVD